MRVKRLKNGMNVKRDGGNRRVNSPHLKSVELRRQQRHCVCAHVARPEGQTNGGRSVDGQYAVEIEVVKLVSVAVRGADIHGEDVRRINLQDSS
jgi:hypothetical protein